MTGNGMAEGPWGIPATWRWSRMGKVADVIGGGTPRTTDLANFDGGDVPWITPADLSGYHAKHIARGARNITAQGLHGSGAKLMPAGTVLFSSRAPIGYVAIAEQPVATNQGFKSFVLNDELLPDYVYYYLQRAKELAVALASGTTFLEISGAKAAEIPIPLPPLPEQHRIVTAIETHLTRLDAAVAALERARARLKRYRAAVLKAACEGRLVPTEAALARTEGRPYESAPALLARIQERRTTVGAPGRAHGRRQQLSTPLPANLADVPEGWAWATLPAISENLDGRRVPLKSADREERDGPYPYYGASGVIDQLDDFLFDGPHLLIAEDGANLLSRSTPIAFRADGRFWVNNHAHVVRFSDRVTERYTETFFNGGDFQFFISGSAQPKLTQAALNRIPIPLPPLAEQERIVAEVERRLSVLDQLDATATTNLKRADALRQSVLRRAFSGDLADVEVDRELLS